MTTMLNMATCYEVTLQHQNILNGIIHLKRIIRFRELSMLLHTVQLMEHYDNSKTYMHKKRKTEIKNFTKKKGRTQNTKMK
jgi:hypothetical protein